MQLSEPGKTALDYIQSIDVSAIEDTIEAGRAFYEEFVPMAGAEEAIFKIEQHEMLSFDQKLNLRIYRPSAEEQLPVVLYFHGGWFNARSLASHDRPLRKLANLSGVVHGFFQMGAIIPDGNRAIEETAHFLTQNFNK